MKCLISLSIMSEVAILITAELTTTYVSTSVQRILSCPKDGFFEKTLINLFDLMTISNIPLEASNIRSTLVFERR